MSRTKASDEQGLSPWSEAFVKDFLPNIKTTEGAIIDYFDNQKQDAHDYHYAENFKEHDTRWLNKIIQNMGIDNLALSFHDEQRAIVVQNTFARALPDSAPDFFNFAHAGQGFPFDNLQESALWVGTPLYVLKESQDKAWSLVITPDAYFAWIKSSDLAYASDNFIKQWQAYAQQGIMAVTRTETSVLNENQQFLFTAYIGAVFPRAKNKTILIPLKNKRQQAVIGRGNIATHAVQRMPMAATKKNIAKLIKQLQNRPYGWGGIFFLNDCSQELKSLFTPLGIWLPRNSGQQAKLSSSDFSGDPIDVRIAGLKTEGRPLMTIIYIGGHVMLYLGTQADTPMTYQNVWGLAPVARDKRYVIGQAVLLPLLKSYPEHPDAKSLANSKYFELIHLDKLPQQQSPSAFVKQIIQGSALREINDN